MPRTKAKGKATSRKVARNAARLLSSAATPHAVRSVAGSALAQVAPEESEVTTPRTKPGPAFKAGKDVEQ